MPRAQWSFVFVGIAILAIINTLAAARPNGANAQLTLKRVREIRQLDLVKSNENVYFMDQPGLALTFELALPQGRQLLEIHQPVREHVHAIDSSGKDLSGVELNFMNKHEYVTPLRTYGEPLKEFMFRLTQPSRKAVSFDLSVDLEAVTFTALKDLVAEVSSEWTDIDPSVFGKKKVQIKIRKDGESVKLTVRPGTVKPAIESVELYRGSEKLERSLSMWSDANLNFSFNGEYAENMTVKFKVRTGLSTEIVSMKLDDQPLP